MASCYLCGRSGSEYRRTVHTGHSFGTFVSKRSYGSSSRNYYGLRTVCENCAASIDKWKAIKTTLFLAGLALVLLYFIGKHL